MMKSWETGERRMSQVDQPEDKHGSWASRDNTNNVADTDLRMDHYLLKCWNGGSFARHG